MKKIIIGLLFVLPINCYRLVGSVLSVDQVEKLLATDRVTNLVIFNDVTETTSKFNMPWDEEKWILEKSVVSVEFLHTLVDNKCPVLCTKSVLLTIQMLYQCWQKFLEQSPDTLLADYQQSLSSKIGSDFLEKDATRGLDYVTSHIPLYKDRIKQLTELYQTINQKKALNDTVEAARLIKELEDLLFPGENGKTSGTISLEYLFCNYAYFNIVCAHDYICKDVNSEFVLFIPKHLISQSDTLMMQDLQQGLSFTGLPDYDYKNVPDSKTRQQIIDVAYKIDDDQSLGDSLLVALKTLILNKGVLKKWISSMYPSIKKLPNVNSALNNVEALLPFFNIFLDGHGDPEHVNAEISMRKKDGQLFSDFERLLRFLNYEMKTKSLTVLSCFPGGKKVLDTFHVQSAFDSSILDNLTYPIINIGTLMSVTTIAALTYGIFMGPDYRDFFSGQQLYGPWQYSIEVFGKYFDLLNEVPSNYEKAFTLISGFYLEDESFDFSNYISVKLPHVSWYLPYEFKKYTKTIFQIEALTKQKMVFAEPLEVVLLGANVIPGEIVFKNFKYNFPIFLPMNYYNQNYVVQKISDPDIDKDYLQKIGVHKYFMNFLPIPSVKESINIVIKTMNIGDQFFNDVYVFTRHVFPEQSQEMSGFIFTDMNNETKIVSWPSTSSMYLDFPVLSFDKNKAMPLIKQVEEQARKTLDQFSGLESDSFQKLEQVMKNKAKGLMPEDVKKSHEIQNRKDMLSRIFDVMYMVDQQKQKEENNELFRIVDVVHSLNIDLA